VTLVTVVVPTRDAARTLEACLASVRAQTHPSVELVVVDNGSTDATWHVAHRHADVVVRRGPERSSQRNHGWRIGRGSVVVFVDADMVLDPDLLGEAVAVLSQDPQLGGLILPERARGDGFLAGCRALEKAIYLGQPNAEAARVFPRDILHRLGGFDEHLTAFEDWELTDRLRRSGLRVGRTRAGVWHDEGRIALRRAFAKKRYYGAWLPAYLARSSSVARTRLSRPALLARPLLLARSPHRAAGLVMLKAVEWAGLLLGARDARRAADR